MADTCRRSAPRRGTNLQPQHAAIAVWRKEKNSIPPTIRDVGTRSRNSRKEVKEGTEITAGNVFSTVLTTPGVSFVAALRGSADKQCPQARHVPTTEKQSVSASAPQQQSCHVKVTAEKRFTVQQHCKISKHVKNLSRLSAKDNRQSLLFKKTSENSYSYSFLLLLLLLFLLLLLLL
jgi:hypothetical protein